MRQQRQELLDFALQLASAAEEQIMPRYHNCAVNQKRDGSDVTEADLAAEKMMREMIARRFPAHAVLGEEFGASQDSRQRHQWILDPLDGTTWFALGVPIFGVLVALLEDNEPILGVIHLPAMGETVYAARGLGCWFKIANSTPIQVHVSASVPLKDAIVSAAGVHGSDIYLGDGEIPYHLTALIQQARKFRFCGDCLQHALVCRGRIHAAVDTIMKPWDSAAIITCIEEAGGIATTLAGERNDVIHGGNLVTTCSESLRQEIVELLQV